MLGLFASDQMPHKHLNILKVRVTVMNWLVWFVLQIYRVNGSLS